MWKIILRSFLIGLIGLSLPSATAAFAEEPMGVITVDWLETPAGAPHRNTDLIFKSLKAAFADTLKKKLNVTDPAGVADLELAQEGQNLRLLIVPRGAVQPTADEILAVAREAFLETVNNFFRELHGREVNEMLDREKDEVDRARARLAESQAQLQRRRAQLRDITHRVDVSPEALRAAITRLEDERDKLALDAESQAVRKKAIEQTIVKITGTAEKQMKTDRIVVELEKLVDSRDAEMKRMQQLAVAKTVAQAEVEAAEARVGEARVRLWERQEVVSRTAGGDLLADLNKELAMLSINMAESEARLDRLGKAVSDYAKAVDLIDELESAQTSRQAAETARVDAEGRLAERARGLREYGPPVVNFHGRK
jgi:hypothetical protein